MTDLQIEGTKPLHWDAISQDYLQYRPGYPGRFFVLLRHLGIGRAGQDILDLGSGTGALAVPFARQGARVTAVDLSRGQIEAGQQASRKHGVKIRFKVAAAEETGFPDHCFDVVSASMCWGYFDMKRMEVEVPRLLRVEGLLLASTLIWVRDEDSIAGQTDKLLAKHAAGAVRLGRGGEAEILPAWSLNQFSLKTYHEFKVDLPFTRQSWRGRIRASKWIGAALSAEQTESFDREHQVLLNRIAPPNSSFVIGYGSIFLNPEEAEAVPPSSRWGYTRIAFICARESLGEKRIGPQLKAAFGGSYIANESFIQATAGQVLAAGKAGAVAFGVPFLANPDLLERFRQNAPLNEPDSPTFYTSGPKGCTDYPALDKTFVNGSQPMKLSKTELSL